MTRSANEISISWVTMGAFDMGQNRPARPTSCKSSCSLSLLPPRKRSSPLFFQSQAAPELARAICGAAAALWRARARS
jgi:hypothetical protein